MTEDTSIATEVRPWGDYTYVVCSSGVTVAVFPWQVAPAVGDIVRYGKACERYAYLLDGCEAQTDGE